MEVKIMEVVRVSKNWYKSVGIVNGVKVGGFGSTHAKAILNALRASDKYKWQLWLNKIIN